MFGREYQENDYVFKWDNGRSHSPDYITSKFPALLKKHGMPHIRLHELRHTFATRLHSAGADPLAPKWLMGHSTKSDIIEHYTHETIAQLEAAIGLLA